ncbi:YtxH domain-containing protein [Niallia sp. XMNu-256]|uniref:YtxH domain-containing protein n=1 Tax=Niallia sp. XMNu-256 TaxID=3082444 RepID=UPI0030D1764D
MSQNILPMESTTNDYARSGEGNLTEGSVSGSLNPTMSRSSSSNNSKLMKGMVIGGIVGGLVAMLDSNTRNTVKDKALTVKDSSMNLITEVKNNPSEVKEQMVESFKEASQVMKEAISHAQDLYNQLNENLIGNVSEVKDITNQTLNTAKEAKGEIAEIGTKVKEAGSTVMDNPVVNAASPSGSASTK